ncbi:hypothetical protein [Polaromonas sp. CG9_12]|nr:hypothetical protein [Polaromonas sp. CG9_12]
MEAGKRTAKDHSPLIAKFIDLGKQVYTDEYDIYVKLHE